MGKLPSGTVTFLFTDIERSTQTVELVGNKRYADLLETHHQLLREAFVAHRGHEVGMEGDSFFVAFASASDAIDAAVAGQRALESYDWPGEARLRVRIGLHTGEALVRGGDYVGHDVHVAKRISDAGHGGQILLSPATTELVANKASLTDLGPHRLKDLGDPQRLYQLNADGLPDVFPPLRSLEAFTHNLPLQRTSFVGREGEITQVQDLLRDHRLVTLTGVGGCGKTRLALQVGADSLDGHPDGVFFIDLAPVSDPEMVASTVVADIGLQMAGDITAEELVFGFLEPRRCLLILDNCEHLLDASAELVDQILGRCPDVTILATSREALEVPGEQAWRIPSLSLPDESGDVQSSEAVSLFKTRAKAARADFELTPDNAPAVAEICRRLDGIPLAIEFAAARTSHLSPQDIAARLNDMFKLLTGGRRRQVQRQQTLQAALDWSHALLTDAEQTVLRRLAVFPASFPLWAAEGVCSGEGVEKEDVLDLLGSLVAKSLVTTTELDQTTRYRLIETVRQYASEKLHESGEADVVRSRHRDVHLAWLRSLSWDELMWVGGSDAVAVEQRSLRAALEWSEAEGRLDLVVAMAGRMRTIWIFQGRYDEGVKWCTIDRPEDLDLAAEEKIAALSIASFLTSSLHQAAAAELADRALAVGADEASVPLVYAYMLRSLSRTIANLWTRDPELADASRRDAIEAVRLAQPYQHLSLDARASQATNELLLGDPVAAARMYADLPMDAAEDVGLSDRCCALHLVADHRRALAAARAYLEAFEARPGQVIWVPNGACAALAGGGDMEAAKGLLREYFERTLRSGQDRTRVDVFVGAAVIAYIGDNLAAASRLLEWVRSRTFDAAGRILSVNGFALYRHYVGLLRAALGPDKARTYRAEGRAMSEDEALAVVNDVLGPATAERGELTNRELEVAGLLSDGMTNRQIADRLVLSERTVDSHVDHIRNKLGLRTRAQIASWVTESRLSGQG